MAKPRGQQKSYISKVDKAKKRISEKPHRVLNIIGQFLASEARRKARKKTGRLKKSIQYWARKKEKDLQVGSKSFYAPAWELGNSQMPAEPFLMPTVMENIDTITELTKSVYREMNNE
ncbi:HK97-gp10 family putative phage morphogenesis protein [Paraclostridium bifermentans]|uniref:HK97-gp10 family putative phage morphogenesis protein n=1 Tax=Paraclostridium bifermentans TaxID=1490 RepID=UPI001C1246F1|nr:HK97-gp10 family putative phage morphogenesis protein [Paraclostridium bifermentans]MBU5289992.1 HK97 gp10 family phage protein [Paraclostridium bifermentans]